jgi:[protein-PII] uridylyltransferase
VARRREDRLVFDLQTAVADSFGHQAHARASAAAEALMHRYYWAAKAVTQLNQILMLNIEERRRRHARTRPCRPIDDELPRPRRHAGGGVTTTSTSATRTPFLRPFWCFAQTPGLQGLSARTLRALYNARNVHGRRLPARPRQPRACS